MTLTKIYGNVYPRLGRTDSLGYIFTIIGDKLMAIYKSFDISPAVPVWIDGEELTMNVTLSAKAEVGACASATLALAASSSFIVLVNDKFIAHGPARCAEGFYYVDELELASHLKNAHNIIEIRAVGYNVNAFSYLDQPSFLAARLTVDGKICAATGTDGFTYRRFTERVQKVQRFSYQRTFAEAYDLAPEADGKNIKIVPVSEKALLCRTVPYGEYPSATAEMFARGTLSYSDKPDYMHDRYIDRPERPNYKLYPLDELEEKTYIDAQKMDKSTPVTCNENGESFTLEADTYALFEYERDYTGIFSFELESDGGDFYIMFDEKLSDGNVNELRMGCTAIIKWHAPRGRYTLVCAEPYTMHYFKVCAVGGRMTVRALKLNRVVFPASHIKRRFIGKSPELKRIYDAAIETFSANAVDIYMDCPSRERAGWLCDSFFTSRVEKVLTGRSDVEHAFLLNFILPEKFDDLPHGMLPMCYPSNTDAFIPQWAMWYVMELREYFYRTGDREFIDCAKKRVYDLLGYFRRFENEYGMLENLESWRFVEWSHANDLVDGLNFPTNMLYSGFKDAISELYGDESLSDDAEKIRRNIRLLSMTDSGFFADQALRDEHGKLKLVADRTEVCQYYAFFFEVATPELYPELFEILLHDFGADRAKTGKYPEIFPANAFIGNYLRLDILCRLGYNKELEDNIRGYFLYMADSSGTLWENMTDYASMNHGFASHVIYWFDKLGMLE